MQTILERVDGVPLQGNDMLTLELQRWLYTLVDSLNTTIAEIESQLNSLDVRVTNLGG